MHFKLTPMFIALIGFLGIGTIIAGYFFNINTLRHAIMDREHARVAQIVSTAKLVLEQRIHHIEEQSGHTLNNEHEILTFLGRPLTGRGGLQRDALAYLVILQHEMESEFLGLTDARGRVLCSMGIKADTIRRLWGLDEALEGSAMTVAAVTVEGLAVVVITPLMDDGEVLGAVISGFRVGDRLVGELSEIAQARISLANMQGIVAGNIGHQTLQDIGIREAAFWHRLAEDRQPVFVEQPASQQLLMLAAIPVVEETLCIIAKSDIGPMYRLLAEKSSTLTRLLLVVLAAVVIIGAFFTRLMIRPLIHLQERARQMASNYSPDMEAPRISGNEIRQLVAAFDVMSEAIRASNTRRDRSEASLRENESLFRALVENSPFGISIWHGDQLVFMNPELKTIIGTAHRVVALKDLPVHGDDRERFEHFWSAALSGTALSGGLTFRFVPATGEDESQSARWVNCSAVSIEYNRKPALLCSMVDVTRSRELEKLALIREKMASLGHAAAGIAHEIRNPLSGINVFLEGIRDNFETPDSAGEIKEMIDEARGASNKIEAVIKRVLDFARPTASNLALADIQTPIREAEKLCRTTLRKAGVRLQMELEDHLPEIHIDAQLIEQVVVNLLVNAVNAMPADAGQKVIRIATRRTNSHIVLTVSDSGSGVAEKHKKSIFEPFFTTRNDGSGIGLSLSQRIVAHHGGTIEVGASAFGGAQFKIQLPMEKRMHRRQR